MGLMMRAFLIGTQQGEESCGRFIPTTDMAVCHMHGGWGPTAFVCFARLHNNMALSCFCTFISSTDDHSFIYQSFIHATQSSSYITLLSSPSSTFSAQIVFNPMNMTTPSTTTAHQQPLPPPLTAHQCMMWRSTTASFLLLEKKNEILISEEILRFVQVLNLLF